MVRELDYCESCNGTGLDGWGGVCPVCQASGRTSRRAPDSSPLPTSFNRAGRWGAWIVAIALGIVFGAIALSRPQQVTMPVTSSPRVPDASPVASTPSPVADVPSTPVTNKATGVTYSAVHRHGFGGDCQGTIRLDAIRFQYDSSQHHLSIARERVRGIDGPGLVDGASKKWHFRLQGKSDQDVERLLRAWLDEGRVP